LWWCTVVGIWFFTRTAALHLWGCRIKLNLHIFCPIPLNGVLSDTTEVVYKKQNSLFVLQGQTGHIFIGPCWPGTALVLFWW
jgi:hypothetical protein